MQRWHPDHEENEDFGQVDGDASAETFADAVQFQPTSPGTPWARSGTPPWHLWGNTVTLPLVLKAGQIFGGATTGQLCKVSYGRPDTWHWLFTAKLVSADNPLAGQTLNIQLLWELTTGIGRSVQQNLAFDNFNFGPIVNPATFPVGRVIWTTQTLIQDPNRAGVVTPPPNLLQQIVAQNIQLSVRAAITTDVSQLVDQSAVLEVGAQFAPKNHIRPDWYQEKVPPETRFPGAEVPAQ